MWKEHRCSEAENFIESQPLPHIKFITLEKRFIYQSVSCVSLARNNGFSVFVSGVLSILWGNIYGTFKNTVLDYSSCLIDNNNY
jgi:hypothetical protein